jgi:2,3,4,5-tetrahydropyridine-2-carboxylate N-succinyltransferase
MTLADEITALWERRAELHEGDADALAVVTGAIDLLDTGAARVAEVGADGEVLVHEWAKLAILLSFKLLAIEESHVGAFAHRDRIPLKTTFDGVRVVPGAIARWGSYVAPGAVLMPSYVNIGGYVDEGTLVDTWATVGSCAQIGKRVHLSGGVGIGGVLEPPQAAPVVVEDDAFIGSRSMVVEGARVRRGAKLGAGVILTSSTRVFDAESGAELARGEAPERAVCVSGTRIKSFPGGDFGLPCVVVLRVLEEGAVHDKLQLNDILREHGIST